MIDYLIHFYRSGTEPFRSLSALDDGEARQIMQELYVEGSVFWKDSKTQMIICRSAGRSKRGCTENSSPKAGLRSRLIPSI